VTHDRGVRGRRSDLPDGVFHVTTRGVDSCAIVRDDLDRVAFLRLLAEVARRFRWRVHAFCLMDTHYHLVPDTTRPRLSDGMKRLNGIHAQLFNRRHGRTGHLFGDRFESRVVEGEEHFRRVCDYVHENPVAAGLCARAEDWRWSTARSKNVRSLR
jgi:putative transposase